MSTEKSVRILQRSDSYINWIENNPLIMPGEICFETETKKFKLGTGDINDSTTWKHWSELNYDENGKGFKILAITGNGYTLSSTAGISVGDTVTIRISREWDHYSTIKSISENVITLKDTIPDDPLETDEDYPESGVIENYLIIEGKPYLGDMQVGYFAHVEGENCIAQNRSAHAEGRQTKAVGQYSHAEGRGSIAGYGSHAEGRDTLAQGDVSHAEGQGSIAKGNCSHAEGYYAQTEDRYAHAEGFKTIAANHAAHAEGNQSQALGENSHAEGSLTIAKESCSHAEGYDALANGRHSHAENSQTTASGASSHAEGLLTQALGNNSHAEGNSTIAKGDESHAEGQYSEANHQYSHAQGFGTQTGATCQTVLGKYNEATAGAVILGNGTSPSKRSNAVVIDWDGSIYAAGNLQISGSAEIGSLKIDNYDNIATNGQFIGLEEKDENGVSYNTNNHNVILGGQSNYLYDFSNSNSAIIGGKSNNFQGSLTNSVILGGRGNSGGTLTNTIISGSDNIMINLANSAAFGHGLWMYEVNTPITMVGKYNAGQPIEEIDYQNFNKLFLVGNGTSDTKRSNAFEVRDNGDIWVSGNILTGDSDTEINAISQEFIVNLNDDQWDYENNCPYWYTNNGVVELWAFNELINYQDANKYDWEICYPEWDGSETLETYKAKREAWLEAQPIGKIVTDQNDLVFSDDMTDLLTYFGQENSVFNIKVKVRKK